MLDLSINVNAYPPILVIEQEAPEQPDARLLRHHNAAILAYLLSCVTPGEEKMIRQAYGLNPSRFLEDVAPVSTTGEVLIKLRAIVAAAGA